MNTQSANATKRLLLIQWLAMLMAVVLYYGLTYLVRVPATVTPPGMKVTLGVLQLLAAITFLAGMVVERFMMARAVDPRGVVTVGIVSAAFGEAIAIFGLGWYFVGHERIWAFFAVSGLYFVRLFARLPDFNARIDELSQ